MCEHYGVPECDGLQGTLIEAHAKAVGDPDTVAARLLSSEATPLGIDVPIEPGGVFPRADPSVAKDEVDLGVTSGITRRTERIRKQPMRSSNRKSMQVGPIYSQTMQHCRRSTVKSRTAA